MNETKPWWTSKTIIGAIVAVIGVGIRLAGYELAEADQAVVTEAVGTLFNVGGSLFAIYGRVTAAAAIGK